jgi:lysozyme
MSNERLFKRIAEHEGFESRVYKCTEGYDTIGYGFAIKDLVMERDIADQILMDKLDKLCQRIDEKFPWLEMAPDEVREVLVEMSYQMGVSGVSKFKKALKYMENNNWSRAADEMLDSKWHRQTPNRAKALSNIIRGLDG